MRRNWYFCAHNNRNGAMPLDPKSIDINEYTYELPEHRIAKFPLKERDQSKLLVYRGGQTETHTFLDLPALLPGNSLLVFNNTKVIHARLYFNLPNGKRLEILCLEPLQPAEYQQNFSSTQTVRWKCLVGGNRKWKTGTIQKTIATQNGPVTLTATRLGRTADAFDIQFEWEAPGLAFGELLAAAGIIPLPPYLKRETEASDEERYQTVYAETEGSVAAPTAGLHFTERVFGKLEEAGMQRAFVTLHVGAGTFKPVSAAALADHHMHEESLYISGLTLRALLPAVEQGQPIIPVGTTSMRLLESLYWHGHALLQGKAERFVNVPQWAPYEAHSAPGPAEALQAVLHELERQEQDVLQGYTQLIIAPGYTFRICRGIITNFHQPKSTLLLLIAAMVGDDWQAIYKHALDDGFRFLSYGDSSLLLP